MFMHPELVIPAVAVIVIVAIIAGSLHNLLKMYMQRGGGPGIPRADLKEIPERLARMEQSIDAIAIEVERLSEGQRFTTKLLSDQARGVAQIPMPIREA
jgi:hypothetical protein